MGAQNAVLAGDMRARERRRERERERERRKGNGGENSLVTPSAGLITLEIF